MKSKSSPLSLLLIAYLAFIGIGMTGGLLNIAWTYMQTTFDVALDSLGVLMTALTLGHILTSFASGAIVSRFGVAVFLLGGTLLAGLGALGYALAPSWPLLLLAATVAGAGGGVLDSGLNTFVSARYSAGRLNWLHASFGIGLTIGPPIVTFFVVNLQQSWRWSYVGVAALLGVVVLLMALTYRSWNIRTEDDYERDDVSAPGVIETLKLPVVILGLALFFVYAGSEVSVGQLTNSLFIEARGVEQSTATFWISLYWAAFTIGRVVMGALADFVSNTLLLRLCMLGGVLGALVLALQPGPVGSPLAMAIIGFSFAPIFPTLVAETPRRVGRRHAPNAIGFQIGIAGVGIAFLPGLGGILGEYNGMETIGPFLVAIAIGTLLLHELILLREARRTAPLPG